ncbi:GvpL/GvpF family gas vesicle protein [Streptomyces poriticola]|uniref:GvpL/GvpF family gas vesicle protein n=1 Tax=Streptomyces poriticola TaxID=3120506 RepID=UPI002FCE310B
MTGLRYVYAVCRPFGPALQSQLTGVAGDPPRLLHHHGLVAVVSHVPEPDFAEEPLRAHLRDPAWLAATARAHQQVVDALTVVTTPLPLRPGTVFRDDSGVRVMIERREDGFRRTLDRLAGRVEWRVGVRVEAEPAQGWAAAEEFAARLHEALAARAEGARLRAPQHPAPDVAAASGTGAGTGAEDGAGRTVLDAAYLVPRTSSEEFVAYVERGTGEVPGIRVELTGPWAGYSFAGADSTWEDSICEDDTATGPVRPPSGTGSRRAAH